MSIAADDFGLSRATADDLRRLFERTPGIEAVWMFGSRARGTARPESDVDLAVDAPGMAPAAFDALQGALMDLPTLHKIDAVHWQTVVEPVFRTEIERDRRVFWQPVRQPASVEAVGTVALKRFQSETLATLASYLTELKHQQAQARAAMQALKAMEGMEDAARQVADFPANAWAALRKQGRLPPAYADRAHSSRWDGAGNAIPNVCLKVPTGGGKTLMAAAGVGSVMSSYLRRHAGLVLWVVPNEAIYRQTLKALNHRDHPYRQLLNVAGAGRVKVLEKASPLTRLDVDSHLCVMLLMLQSASRQSKETLKFFRDRGNVLGFLPGEDDIEAHWSLLQRVPNLDAYGSLGQSAAQRQAQKGSIVKSSLGNVMRLVRPIVVIDEGHHAYSETALKTIDGFNPSFMLELSATPRVGAGGGSNILVDVRGTDLDEAEMIKLPIQVDVKPWQDWQSCLAAAVARLDELQQEADLLRADTARYIRPMLLVQVERTGSDLLEAGFIHAEHAKAYLLQLGLSEKQIAIKTSDRDDLKSPENIDLLSPTCEVRAIITKQALQEGWDCPFAYVLCALAAGRNLGAMTQLIGRILRLPQVAKTGRPALDACYVLCHDARTGEVVKAIKKSLESEGMGDLGVVVNNDGAEPDAPKPVTSRRRPDFTALRIFLPTVTWVEADGRRRALDYDSDVLGALPWHALRTEGFAADWAPDAATPAAQHFALGLEILDRPARLEWDTAADTDTRLDRVRVVRALLDMAPNAWLAWQWVGATVDRLVSSGLAESALARSTGSLIERLRVDLEAERDRLALDVFGHLLGEGRIEFRLRADALDYELPMEATQFVSGKPQWLLRDDDGQAMQKSLLAPVLRTPDLNAFEQRVAGYLDQQAAVRWWHRNVAKSQVGLQGWKRHKVYPDFVFALRTGSQGRRLVLLETKGLHLQGEDTRYKQALLARLSEAFRDERGTRIGSLELSAADTEDVVCDLVFDAAWQGALAARYFGDTAAD
jgi:type III restriction enzyme